jgi:hypothetical protein
MGGMGGMGGMQPPPQGQYGMAQAGAGALGGAMGDAQGSGFWNFLTGGKSNDNRPPMVNGVDPRVGFGGGLMGPI